jgi:ABC-type sugar transport system ATPase subunit
MIEIRDLCLSVGDFCLDRVNLSVDEGDYFAILGPTGSGKTLLLESIAGLYKNKSGSIWIDGEDVSLKTPEERKIGYVPQDFVLFPFLSVRENILFPLQERHKMTQESLSNFEGIVDLLRIDSILERQIRKLSGGEKQRTALARALVTQPKLLLLDEPYSSLDVGLRRKLWLEMKELHKQLGATTIHVTHDLGEAFTLAENAAVMISGRVEQMGKKEAISRHPANRKVAAFLGIVNVFEGTVVETDSNESRTRVKCKDFEIVSDFCEDLGAGDRVGFLIRSEEIKILTEAQRDTCDCENLFQARVVSSVSHGRTHTTYHKISDSRRTSEKYDFEVYLPSSVHDELQLAEGQETTLAIAKDAVHIFDGKT